MFDEEARFGISQGNLINSHFSNLNCLTVGFPVRFVAEYLLWTSR